METLKNIPSLRFPEFKGEWKNSNIEDYFEFKNGLNKEKDFFGRGTPIINFTDVYKLTRIREKDIKGLVELTQSEKDRFSAKIGDVFFTRTSETIHDIGMTATLIDDVKDCVFSGFVLRARPKCESFVPGFTSYLFSINSVRKEIVSKSSMTTRALTSGTLLNKVSFKFPISLKEQTKIASFLTAVDEKIQALKQKKNLLEQYKKGVMQKIFSQELRFKDDNGNEYPDWDEKKLGEVLIKNSNKNKGQKYTLVQSVSNKHGFINQDEMFEDRRVASKDTSNYYVIEKGHFAYNPSRIDVGSLAYKFDDNTSVISPLYISFNANNDCLSDAFLLEWFSTQQFTRQMNSSFEGSVRNTLSYESLTKIEIEIPCLEEQTKIANFLSAIDDKINHCGVQIEKMEVWKKGLLQQMFC